MKKVCIYHLIDLDGWMSAAIVKLWNQNQNLSLGKSQLFKDDNLDFIGYNYNLPIPDLSEYDQIIMCDISFPKEKMQNLYNKITWIDHHISAIKESEGTSIGTPYDDIKGLRNTKFAACELTWQYFFPNKTIPEIVRLLGRYDCFGHKGTDEEIKVLEFQYGARQCISNYEEAFTELLYSLQNYPIASEIPILESGKAIYKYLCQEAKQIYKNGFKIVLSEKSFLCINKERFNPINFGIDYHKDGYDGVACFHYANKKWNFSIYNDNGLVDCSIIAKNYNGGGHKGASGFIIEDINIFLETVKFKIGF